MDYYGVKLKTADPDISDSDLKSAIETIRDNDWTSETRVDFLANVCLRLFERLEALSKRTPE